ncbi:hypothetical protein FMEAI12_6500104 [Parafrankia sp. Ea1.12]|nr:hypothetical protein FMEAI12_6500104 [Parafrankia sp. Ea1.12]
MSEKRAAPQNIWPPLRDARSRARAARRHPPARHRPSLTQALAADAARFHTQLPRKPAKAGGRHRGAGPGKGPRLASSSPCDGAMHQRGGATVP